MSEPLVVVDIVDQGLGGHRVGGLHHGGAEDFDALEVGADLVEVAPDLAVVRAAAAIHDADDVPLAAREVDLLAQLRVGEALARPNCPTTISRWPALNQRPGASLHVAAAFRCRRAAGRGP